MKNTIAHRVLDFLKKFPPFSFIEESLLLDLSKEVEIIYKEKDESIYQFNEDYKPYFYIVHKGSISLLREEENQKIVVDICDEGDIFGLRPLIAKEPYLLTARCYEESIIYAIPVDVFKNITENNQKISEYLIASFAANRKNPVVIDNMNKLDRLQLNPQIEIYNIQPISFSKNTLTCQPEKSVKEVAIDMVDKKVGATVILKDKLPIGIVTNKDLRNKIATGLQPITAKVEDIMSAVITCDINTNILRRISK